jgi:D-alanyl-D-alanine carboxypeptidase
VLSVRSRLAVLVFLCCSLLAAAPATAGAQPVLVPPASETAGLQSALDQLVAGRGGPPGIAVVLTDGAQRTFLHAGVANLKTGAAPRIDDHIRIASVAKAFNSYLAVKIAERHQGGFSLEETLGESIPGTLPNAEAVTAAELLQHTSGLAEYISSEAFVKEFEKDLSAYFSPQQIIGFIKDDPLEFRPGSRYHYSDSDNIAVGLMEQAATGKTYQQLLGSLAFGPLGMSSSSLPKTVRMPRPAIDGYEVAAGEPAEDVTELINPAGAWASGGIVSTPADLARFLPAYVPTVLGAVRKLPRPFRPGSSSPPGPGTNSAGIGIFRYRTKCGTVYGHTGSFPGYRIFVAADAAGTRGVVFAVNSQILPGGDNDRVAAAIRSAQLQAVCAALH